MSKRVIEIPEGLEALGEAIAAMVARVQGTVAATGGGGRPGPQPSNVSYRRAAIPAEYRGEISSSCRWC